MEQNQEKQITARSWIILENKTKKYWRGDNTMQKLEIASLTKMYTLFACLQINDILHINPESFQVQVIQTTQCGTLARLIPGKYITIKDLYYGLMLPSGNDAALLLAYYYGFWLGKADKIPAYQWKKQRSESLEGKRKYSKIYLSRFMNYLNSNLVKNFLKHSETHFQNPHGLPDKLQRSTVWEVAYATIQFLKNPIFSNITQADAYESSYFDEQGNQDQLIYWENTNQLLRSKYGYIGIKTGHTASAGNCLASRKIIQHKGYSYDFVIVVLGCQKLHDRFKDTLKLMQSLKNYLQTMV